MTAQNDLDRTLGAWFHGDATTAPPDEPLARVIDATRTVRPRVALIARVGSSWTDADRAGIAGPGLRPALVLALVALLALAVAGSALLAGGRLLSNPYKPMPFGLAGNGVIAVAKDGDILVADRPGGELRPLVTGPENDAGPMFSPDGTKLAFLREIEQGQALMLADADGTNLVQLTSEPVGYQRFAPDGRSLVGLARDEGATFWHVDLRPLDKAADPIVLDVRLYDGAMEISQWGGPEFRPTNEQEILVVGALEPDGPRGIYVYDVATNEIRTVLEPGGYVHDVAWTLDGESITYDLTDETSVQSRVVAADGSGDRPLLEAPGTSWYHRVGLWSNDGTRAVIARQQPEGVFVVSTGGDGEAVRLACGEMGCPSSWTWSPDDSMLIGTLQREDPTNVDTLLVTSLVADPDTGRVTELDWDVDLNDPQQWQRVAP